MTFTPPVMLWSNIALMRDNPKQTKSQTQWTAEANAAATNLQVLGHKPNEPVCYSLRVNRNLDMSHVYAGSPKTNSTV